MTAVARKWFKRLVLVLAIIPILIFLAFLGAINFIDFNGYKPQIEKEVSEYTGRSFKIDGSIDVSVMPLVFSMGKSHLAQPQGFSAEVPQFSVRSIEVEVSMWSLLVHKKVELLSLEVLEPQLNLIRDVDGRDNWSDLPAISRLLPLLPVDAEQTQLSQMPLPLKTPLISQAYAQQEPQSWNLQSLVVNNASINLDDHLERYQLQLTKLNLFTMNLQPGRACQLRSDFQYHHSLSPRTVDFRVTTDFEMDPNLQNYKFSNWQGVASVALPKEHAMPRVHLTTSGTAMKVDLAQKKVQMEQLNLEGLNGKLKTSFTGRFGAVLDINGTISAQNISLEQWSRHLALPLPQKDDPQWQQVNGDYQWQWRNNAIRIQKAERTEDKTRPQ